MLLELTDRTSPTLTKSKRCQFWTWLPLERTKSILTKINAWKSFEPYFALQVILVRRSI
jgi:hypothetical protein